MLLWNAFDEMLLLRLEDTDIAVLGPRATRIEIPPPAAPPPS